MDVILPAREAVERRGWLYQVQWVDEGRPCFIRCKSGAEADTHAEKLRKTGSKPFVIDLRDALQLH